MNYDIEKIEKNVLTLHDSFNFKCRQCGKCCTHREDILLTPYDLFRISKELFKAPQEIFERYCETYIGQQSKFPVVRLKPKDANLTCPLLRNGRCIVHKSKPVVCALYPLGRFVSSDSKTTKYFIQEEYCGNRNKSYTLQQWLNMFDIPENDENHSTWSEFLFYFNQQLPQIDKLKEDIQIKLYNFIFSCIYLNYTTDENYIEQLKSNIDEIKAMFSILNGGISNEE